MFKAWDLLNSIGENSLESSLMNYKDFNFVKPENFKRELREESDFNTFDFYIKELDQKFS